MANSKPIKRSNGSNSEFSVTDTVPPNNLGSGTANSDTVLFGDNVWRTPTSASMNPDNYVQVSNYTLPAYYSLVVHDEYEISDGFELELADAAHMEIT